MTKPTGNNNGIAGSSSEYSQDEEEVKLTVENFSDDGDDQKNQSILTSLNAHIVDAILENRKHFTFEFNKTVVEYIEGEELVKAIELLRIKKDKEQGIISSYAVYKEEKVFIRDATKQTNHNDTYHDWAILGINYAAAAIKVLESHGINIDDFKGVAIDDLGNNFNYFLHSDLAEFLKEIESKSSSSNAEISLGLYIHEKLIPLLLRAADKTPDNIKSKLTKKLIEKQLAEVRDFSNFDHQKMSVATTIQAGDSVIQQIDVALTGGLSEDLRQDYEALADNRDMRWYDNLPQDIKKLMRDHAQDILDRKLLPDKLKDFLLNSPLSFRRSVTVEDYQHLLRLNSISWYQDQKPHIQYLIRKYAPDILQGKPIPTQHRKYFPGIRNGGEEFIVDVKTKKIIQHHYHAGTPAHALKVGNQKATDQSIKQLEELTGAKHVLVLSLLSPWSRYSNDGLLVNQIESAVNTCNGKKESSNFLFSNIPLNPWRGRVPNQMMGANWLVKQAKDTLEMKSLPPKCVERNNLEELIKEFNTLSSGSSFFSLDSENRNLRLVSVIERLSHAVNEAHRIIDPNDTQPFVAAIVVCQSGKDRAGLARIKTTVDAVIQYFKPQNQSKSIEMQAAVIKAGQVAAQASFQGGTMGAGGLKKDTKPALPASWKQWENILFKKTASYNKGIPKDPRKLKWYKNKKTLIAAGLLVTGVALCATGIGALAGIPLMTGGVIGGVVGSLSVAALGTGVGMGVVTTVAGIKYSNDSRKENHRISNYNENKGTSKASPQTDKISLNDTEAKHDGVTYPGFPGMNKPHQRMIEEWSREGISSSLANASAITFFPNTEEGLAMKHVNGVLQRPTLTLSILKYCIYALKYEAIAIAFSDKLSSADCVLLDKDGIELKSIIEKQYPPEVRPNHINKILELKNLNPEVMKDPNLKPISPRS